MSRAGVMNGIPCPPGSSTVVQHIVTPATSANSPRRHHVSVAPHSSPWFMCWLAAIALLLLLFVVTAPSHAQTLPGSTIRNVAQLDYGVGGVSNQTDSNPVELITRAPRSDAVIDLIKISAGAGERAPIGVTDCAAAGGGSVELPAPVLLDGTVIDAQSEQSLIASSLYHATEPVFIRVEDADQNLDGRARDRISVTLEAVGSADRETITLSETGDNTGVFTGYLPTSPAAMSAGDCQLQLRAGDQFNVLYRDPEDTTDVAQTGALVDPLGVVFDSTTGALIDGVQVTLINVQTGQPADVVGDDGVSPYPATVVTGGRVTDGGGTIYQFADGQFRFPLIAPGTYRLDVTPPPAYSGPSQAQPADLAVLPGAPFAIEAASFGDTFEVAPGPVINIDVPLDPRSVELFLQKTTPATTAAPGDFVEYALTLENANGSAPARSLRIIDTLPPGFRLVAGSVRLDGEKASDPQFDGSASNLIFSLPDLAPGEPLTLRYVVQVTGAARGDEAVNTAYAEAANGLSSNLATARLTLYDDLFSDRSFLVGRVLDGACGARTDTATTGISNVRIYLEDGRYAVTDETGRYHFEGLNPGGHVVQLDTDSMPEAMEIRPCPRQGFFAGRAYSQFVDLAPGALWRADFYLRPIPPPAGAVSLELLSTPHDAANEARYELRLNGQGVPVSDLKIMLMLPQGVDLRSGSARLDGNLIKDPGVNANTLTFALGERNGAFDQRIEFDTVIADVALGELTTKAVALFDTPVHARQRTPLAETRFARTPPKSQRIERVFTPRFGTRKARLSAADRLLITNEIDAFDHVQDLTVRVTGHTDNVPIAAHNRTEFANNQVLSQARAKAVARFIGETLGLSPDRVSYVGVGADRPVADNATASGRARNRRVEVMLFGQTVTQSGKLESVIERSGVQRIATTGVHQNAAPLPVENGESPQTDWFVDDDWLDTASPEPGILLPALDANPAIDSIKVVVRHGGKQRVALTLNGEPVSPLNFDGVSRGANRQVGVSRWRGVDLTPGNNTLGVQITNADGTLATTLSRHIHFAGGPVRGELRPDSSVLVADGRTVPVLTLALFDRDGQPARPDSVGVYQVDPPYRSMWQINAERDNALIVVGDRDPVYHINARGEAQIRLEPTSEAGEVTLRLRFENGREEEIRAWLKPAARDWVLVALADGTAGLNKLSDNRVEARRAGVDEDYYQEGRIAFFAKGRVRGDHLLTLAYDTDGDEDDARERLFGQIDPDRFYTLYGDATDQRFDAASAEKLYVKIEREQFYALYGDFDTGLNVTELARYNRTFNGFKTEWQGSRVAVSAFATQTDQAFVKDELRGDGTSGLYRLTRQPIIVNSEKITLETRDRFRSERVLESRALNRHLDYDIDYLNGTLFFKQPVQSRDRELNPIYIVADYESRDVQDTSLTAGGRVSLKLGERMVLGASALREGVSGADGDLYAVDARIALGDVTELRAEIARSDTQQNGLRTRGDGYLVTLNHQGPRVDGQAYARQQEAGFGLGQQRGTEAGTRKYGMDGRLRLSKRLSLESEIFRQRSLTTDAVRDVAQAQVRYQAGRGSVAVGMRYAGDRLEDGERRRSRQAFTQLSAKAFDDRVTLRASHDQDLDGGAQNNDYPARTTLGADLKLHAKADVFIEHEMASGTDLDADTTRVGVRATPWERARINASVNRAIREYGPRVFANVGLVQGWQLSEKWTADFGLDLSNTVSDGSLGRVNESVPLASGNEITDFTSAFVGALYRAEHWSATSRYEVRRSDLETRNALLFGLYREENAGVGFTADAEIFDSARAQGADTLDAQLRLGIAWRPDDSRWTIFNRFDAILNDTASVSENTNGLRTWKLINNFSANRQTAGGSQLSLRYGAKYVQSAVGDDTYTGFSDLLGAQWRRPLNDRWDLGLHGNVRHTWGADVYDYSLGIETGVAVVENTWISLGYNVVGFEDDDFAASGYVAQGPYLRFRIKADQNSLGALRRRLPFISRKSQPAPE
ncbi:MAG: OmpA family protein [Gammaproteobacteria bacterium]